MNLIDIQIKKLQNAGVILVSPASIFSLPGLGVALIIAFIFLAWRQKCRRGVVDPIAILRAMYGRHILLNRSTYADLTYYLINTFCTGGLIGWGLFSGSTVSGLVIDGLRENFGNVAPSTSPEWLLRASLTLLTFFGYELGYYIDHYLKHKIPFLWEFHKTHHTAEVLTPLTVFRVHPIDSLTFINITSITAGSLHGLFIYAVGKNINFYVMDSVNIIAAILILFLAHLQHSQFWIPLRGLPGRILLSPAHHQVHHSADPAHYNTNLGNFLAIFDWMFGTLNIPQKMPPRLKFGTDYSGKDPHRLSALLLDPLVYSWRVIVPKSSSTKEIGHRKGVEG